MGSIDDIGLNIMLYVYSEKDEEIRQSGLMFHLYPDVLQSQGLSHCDVNV